MSMHEIVYQPDGKRGRFSHNTNLLSAARELGVDVNALCGGAGSCGKCVVKIVNGTDRINEPTLDEVEIIGSERLGEGYRLACCASILGDVVVLVPKESRTGTQRLQSEGLKTTVKVQPFIWRKTEGKTTHVYHGETQIDVLEGEAPIHGFAVDIGSTKLAGYLMDLSTGETLAVTTAMNPQIPYGEDIISRLSYALQGRKEQETLHKVLVDGVNQLLREACAEADTRTENVYDIVFVGNTAMQHFLLDLDPQPLTYYPFTPENTASRDLYSSKFGIGNKNARIHIPPLIAGFVGADCVSAIHATGIHKSEELCFLMDIGTNTEIVVGNRDRMIACSCASGPAFEGAHIRHGMRAASGAIEGVWINPETLEPKIMTISDSEATGICGSGLIDLLSEMLKAGIIDSSGRFNQELKSSRIRKNGEIFGYVVAWEEDSGLNEDIVVSQLDVRELQKGKAAMFSGAHIVMNKFGVSPDEIKNVYMAGAFGTYINRESALNIGMLPDFNLLDIEQVGNAAGTGARMTLLSRSAREEAKAIGENVEYVELATCPDYNQAYLDALMFPHMNLELFPRTTGRLQASNWVLGRVHQRR